jgi:hypothetical protein
MAPTSDAPAAGGKPSRRQYLIVGGVTLAAALGYMWWKKRQAAAAPAAATADSSGTAAPSTPTGLSTAALFAWIQDHTSSTTTTTTTGTKPKPGPKVTVPNVVGAEYMEASKTISGAGLVPHRAEPDVGKVVSEFPKAGAKVAHGSVVVLSGKGGK